MNRNQTRRRSRRSRPGALALGCLATLLAGAGAFAGESGYIGSEACGSCHAGVYNDFRLSGHPYKLVSSEEARVRPIPVPQGYTWDDVSYVIGGYKWKARFIDLDGYIITGVDTTGDGEPDTDGMNQYNFLTRRWVDYHPGEQRPYDCGQCHTTGWVADADWETDDDLSDNQDGLPGMHGTFAFGGVQCEGCHGPAAHFGDDLRVDGSGEFCGTCHIRGSADTIPASGGFIRHHEQYNEMLASPHASLDCTACHDPHKRSADSIRVSCGDCHGAIAESYAGTVMDEWSVTCEDCHMPMASKSADALGPYKGDIKTHLFLINTRADGELFTPDGSFVQLTGSGKAAVTLDFACLSCHTTESMQWAELYAEEFHGVRDNARDESTRRRRTTGLRMGIFH